MSIEGQGHFFTIYFQVLYVLCFTNVGQDIRWLFTGPLVLWFSVVLDGILFILTGNDDIHKSLNEFEIRLDPTTDHRVSCP